MSVKVYNSFVDPLDNDACSSIYLPTELGEVAQWVIFGVLALVAMVTVAANICVIVKINRNRTHKDVTRLYITSLAYVDVCMGLTVMPYQIFNKTFSTFSKFLYDICDFMASLEVMLCTASIILLSVISFERYVALCKPFSYNKWCSSYRMTVIYILCWLLAAGTSFGIIIPGYSQVDVDETVLNCLDRMAPAGANCTFVVGTYYSTIMSVFTIFCPVVFTVWVNYRVVVYVRRQSKTVESIGRSFVMARRARVSRVLACLTGCFIFCWIPFFVSNILATIYVYDFPEEVFTVAVWLGYINSAANPILYLYLQRKG